MNDKQPTNSMKVRIIALLLGLFINALGNGLTIASNTGSALWTAAAVNLGNEFKIASTVFIFAFGVFNAVLNQFLVMKLNIVRFIEEIAYVVFFSYGIQVFIQMFESLGIGKQSFLVRSLFSIIGVTMIGISVSVYQRANIFMHPNDDTSNILRFKFLNGSAIKAQFLDLSFPVIVIIITSLLTGELYAVNFATIYFFFTNGIVVKYADKWVWPSLIHNFNPDDNFKIKS
ncbi:hypothetical protein MOO44_00520 (plasmid) [Nicoliella spurrieriana]|uniref:Uncharacterized protein n=1 Tax=Nicoliella spurrieriana TaxID=2925830 RepID=A0A976X4T6_9LACO|nr:hypothetical protein [Nicoliella spurrieriana]UQS86160.1 hypothetical protein MOO44_00520 [Nicoliella spurrieriana]